MHDQRGEIITSWLLQMVILMTVLGLLGYEVVSVVITTVNLDGTARDVAAIAASQYDGREEELEAATAAATGEALRQGAELNWLEPDADHITVEVHKQASTLWVHRIGPLKGLTQPVARGRARWR